jgi:metallo-beta-lactamase class B
MRHSLSALMLATAAIALLPAPDAQAQSSPPSPSDFPAQTQFPKENKAAVAHWLSAARHLAEPDLVPEFNWRCLTSPLDRPTVFAIQHDGLIPATRVFDQLYSVGQNAVSAWALDTSDGIILIDALNSPDEARDIIVPNLIKLGLDPKRIKYVVVTHGHGDHWGGAKYLQDTYGARVVMSGIDWDMVEKPGHGGGPFADLVPPRRDIAVKDGDVIALGQTKLHLYVTPGHTPGALSMIFPVTDNGTPHVAGLMGGTGGGQDSVTVHQQVASLQRWEQVSAAAGVDALITNHPSHQSANEKLALVRYAMPGDANPFIYGKQRHRRFVEMLAACSRVQLSRMGETGE